MSSPETLLAVLLNSHNIETDLVAQSGELTEETAASAVSTEQLTVTVTDGERQHETTDDNGYVHFYRQVDPFPDQGLSQILSRKYRVSTFTWSGLSAQGALLATLNFPYALLQTSSNLLDKINRFHYFRAQVKLEFHVGGTMYHQGALMAAVMPFYYGTVTAGGKFSDVWTMSTLDHVHISPDSNTTTSITIPYRSLVSHWRHDMDTNVGYIGTCVIRVLNPLLAQNSATNPTIPVTVFAQFVNPEVMGPTLHAQSSEQRNKSSSGILSKTLERVSEVTSALSLFPSLSPIAQGASGILGGTSKLAKMFGFDKPDSIESFKPVYLSTANAMSEMNGMNTVSKLTMDSENAISNQPEDFGHSISETNISYLCSQPGMFYTGTYDASVTAGTVLYKWHNSPCIAPAMWNCIQHIPCSAIARNFKYWHGDMKYTIFFKTSKFTVSKVRISYHPTYSEITLSPEGEGDFGSMVVDVVGDTTVSFTIPYLKNEPYSSFHDARKTAWDESQYAGAIAISIVNPITPVDDGVMLVSYNIYAAAHPTMDFQLPFDIPSTSGVASDYDYIDMINTTFGPPFVAQSGSVKINTQAPTSLFEQEFPYLVPSKPHLFSKVVSGEKIGSILDLLHRFQFAGALTLVNDTPLPFRYPYKDVAGQTYTNAFDFFRYWFYFARGGISYKLIPASQASPTDATMQGTIYISNQCDSATYSTVSSFGREGTVVENMHYKPSIEWSIGHYSLYPYWWREFTDYPDAYRNLMANNLPIYNGSKINYQGIGTTDEIKMKLFIAARDDTSFGYAKGCPKEATTEAPLKTGEVREVPKTQRLRAT